MGLYYRFLVIIIGFLVVLMACNKDSESDKPYEDPRFFGYMEAKVNGELKRWDAATVIVPHDYRCYNAVQGGYLSVLPDTTETISIGFDVSPDWGCEEYYAYYAISSGEYVDNYGSRDICEDDDPFTPRYICHDVSFTMSPVGNDIYRGTFSFVASMNCGEDEVVVTDGKFEVKASGNKCDYN